MFGGELLGGCHERIVSLVVHPFAQVQLAQFDARRRIQRVEIDDLTIDAQSVQHLSLAGERLGNPKIVLTGFTWQTRLRIQVGQPDRGLTICGIKRDYSCERLDGLSGEAALTVAGGHSRKQGYRL